MSKIKVDKQNDCDDFVIDLSQIPISELRKQYIDYSLMLRDKNER